MHTIPFGKSLENFSKFVTKGLLLNYEPFKRKLELKFWPKEKPKHANSHGHLVKQLVARLYLLIQAFILKSASWILKRDRRASKQALNHLIWPRIKKVMDWWSWVLTLKIMHVHAGKYARKAWAGNFQFCSTFKLYISLISWSFLMIQSSCSSL